MSEQETGFEKWLDNTVLVGNPDTVAEWAWQAAKTDSEREIAGLKAHINVLREALEKIVGHDMACSVIAKQALASTENK